VLKLLQKSYLGKVKMIYIDPPYNTGNDFIYPDDFSESLQTYLEYTGQADAEGRKFSTNTEASGRFHSNWMNMMYPRLYLARNLLSDHGVVFVSIDDHEADNLHKVCNDVFGEENFVAQLVWEKGRKNDAKLFSIGHEYIVVYARSLAGLRERNTIWREQKPGAQELWDEYERLRSKRGGDHARIEADLQTWFTGLPANHPSRKLARYRRVDVYGPWRDRDISWPGGEGPSYDVLHPATGQPCKVPDAGWRFSNPEEMQRQIQAGLVQFRADHTEPPFRKAHLRPIPEELAEDGDAPDEDSSDEDLGTSVRGSYFYKQSQVAVKYLRSIMGKKVFDNPKDHEELLRLIKYVTRPDDDGIVLDFFAGSGSTAEAVLHANLQTKRHLKFILVQLPEPCNPKERSGKAAIEEGLATIADICEERVRRVIKKLNQEDAGKLPLDGKQKQDRGFRVFKLAESNFLAWNADIPQGDVATLEKQLEMHVDHVRHGRTAEDRLYELLLKSGFPLTTPVETLTIRDKTVYSIAEGAMLICLDEGLTLEVMRAMAARKPSRVVCLDEGFAANDQLKANAVQTFKDKSVFFQTV